MQHDEVNHVEDVDDLVAIEDFRSEDDCNSEGDSSSSSNTEQSTVARIHQKVVHFLDEDITSANTSMLMQRSSELSVRDIARRVLAAYSNRLTFWLVDSTTGRPIDDAETDAVTLVLRRLQDPGREAVAREVERALKVCDRVSAFHWTFLSRAFAEDVIGILRVFRLKMLPVETMISMVDKSHCYQVRFGSDIVKIMMNSETTSEECRRCFVLHTDDVDGFLRYVREHDSLQAAAAKQDKEDSEKEQARLMDKERDETKTTPHSEESGAVEPCKPIPSSAQQPPVELRFLSQAQWAAIDTFVQSSPSSRPVRLSADTLKLNHEQLRAVASAVRELRYESVTAPNGESTWYLRRSIRPLCEQANATGGGRASKNPVNFLIEAAVLPHEILELCRTRLFWYRHKESDGLYRIRGYRAVVGGLATSTGWKLIATPTQRLTLTHVEINNMKLAEKHLSNSPHESEARLHISEHAYDDARDVFAKEIRGAFVLKRKGGEVWLARKPKPVERSAAVAQPVRDITLSSKEALRQEPLGAAKTAPPPTIALPMLSSTTSPHRRVMSVEEAVATCREWIASQLRGNRLEFCVFMYDAPRLLQCIGSELAANGVAISTTADALAGIVRVACTLQPTFSQYHRNCADMDNAGILSAPTPAPTMSSSETPTAKELYAQVAAGQQRFPPGYSGRYIHSCQSLVLFDHVKRLAYRPELGESLADFSSSLSAGLREVRSVVERSAVALQSAAAAPQQVFSELRPPAPALHTHGNSWHPLPQHFQPAPMFTAPPAQHPFQW